MGLGPLGLGLLKPAFRPPSGLFGELRPLSGGEASRRGSFASFGELSLPLGCFASLRGVRLPRGVLRLSVGSSLSSLFFAKTGQKISPSFKKLYRTAIVGPCIQGLGGYPTDCLTARRPFTAGPLWSLIGHSLVTNWSLMCPTGPRHESSGRASTSKFHVLGARVFLDKSQNT